MTRSLIVLLVLALAAPLFASGLVEKVFARKIADDWYKHFQDYVEGQCKAGKYPETWFEGADGTLQLFRIQSVSDGKLITFELVEAADAKGNISRSPAKESTTFEWSQWQPRFIATTYPVATNPDTQDVIAFAVWLYLNADDPMIANRVLTVVYEANPDMRDDITDFVREHHAWSPKDKLAVGEMWDEVFAKWRRVLLPKKEAEQLEKDRSKECKAVSTLLDEYRNAEARTLTLAQIAYGLREWRKKHGASDTGSKYLKDVEAVLDSISTDLKNVETLVALADGGAKAAKPQWDAVAKDYEKALALDNRDARLLSLTADAWRKHANPEVVGGQFKCTQEHSARRALELYERWHESEPTNYKVVLNMAVCNHVIGQRNDARKLYQRVIDESEDAALIKQARDYDKLP
ncbi:MAG: hypothetical protein H6839_09065 [Planctomycetes bacterium]|nr:hypothetical protein [Planctomycetota bacterium]